MDTVRELVKKIAEKCVSLVYKIINLDFSKDEEGLRKG